LTEPLPTRDGWNRDEPRFATMPKAELHLHLEGAIPLAAMWRLVADHRDPEVPDVETLRSRFVYRDFDEFIATWIWKNRYLDTYAAFRMAAEAVAQSLVDQNILYAEVFFSPSDFHRHGLESAELALAIRHGLDRVNEVEVALIVDLVRDAGPVQANRTFDEIFDVAVEAGIIGVGLGGSEAEYPPHLFSGVYSRAHDDGFGLTAHAGEAAGPESVRGVLGLGVQRIGHGIRSVEDPELFGHLIDQQAPLEVCPTSNIRTGVVSGWEEHPAAKLIDAGAMVTINTDDPAMFGCTLAGEYEIVADRFAFGDATVRRLAENSITASWADDDTKRHLRRQLDDWWLERS
jgi:adenosine deaminase